MINIALGLRQFAGTSFFRDLTIFWVYIGYLIFLLALIGVLFLIFTLLSLFSEDESEVLLHSIIVHYVSGESEERNGVSKEYRIREGGQIN